MHWGRFIAASVVVVALAATFACGSSERASSTDASDAIVDASSVNYDVKPTCVVEGIGFSLGQPIVTEHHCGLCRCGKYGLECSPGVCPGTCIYEGKEFAAGTWLSTDEGCGGGCSCNVNVRGISCKLRAVCHYGGVTHCDGETFPALDGCNECTCENSGRVFCTLKGCLLDAGFDGL